MKFTDQEIEAAKEVSCVAYLESVGYKPKSERGKTVKFAAPWRPEGSPSLHVYKDTNSFVDFGDKTKAGSVIQLVMCVDECGFKDAVAKLLGKEQTMKAPRTEHVRDIEPAIRIISTGPIVSQWLKQYIISRGIPVDVVKEFCKQATIQLKDEDGEPYQKTCIAFRNEKGGWEFRNPKTKISNSPKYFTRYNPDSKKAVVFEGFMDFLTYVSIYGFKESLCYIVLNSVSFADYVDWAVYDEVYYVGDNDAAGEKCMAMIADKTSVKDCRHLYHGRKDLNAYVMSIHQESSIVKQQIQSYYGRPHSNYAFQTSGVFDS